MLPAAHIAAGDAANPATRGSWAPLATDREMSSSRAGGPLRSSSARIRGFPAKAGALKERTFESAFVNQHVLHRETENGRCQNTLVLLWCELKLGRASLKPRKLILSRKGFDTGSGGCPSPIFPDGTMFSLPIPSGDAEAFEDLQHCDVNIASVVSGITNGRMSGRNLIHLDPDLNFNAYRYRKDRAAWQQWRGMLGQTGESKERTFESSFVMALRQPRRGAGSPARAAGNGTRKPAKSGSDSEKPLQQSLPLENVAEREDPVPQVKPVAIRPRPRKRGAINKRLQRGLPLDQQPDPPISP